MSNNYAGQTIKSKDITDLMCRVNAISGGSSFCNTIAIPSGWNFTFGLSDGASFWYAIDDTAAAQFKLINIDTEGTEIDTWTFNLSDFAEAVADENSYLRVAAFSIDRTSPNILWLMMSGTRTQDVRYWYYYKFNLTTSAITYIAKQDTYSMAIIGTVFKFTNIFGSDTVFFVCYLYYTIEEDQIFIIDKYVYSGIWTKTNLLTISPSTLSSMVGWSENDILVQTVYSQAINKYDSSGNFIEEICSGDYTAFSPGFLSQFRISVDGTFLTKTDEGADLFSLSVLTPQDSYVIGLAGLSVFAVKQAWLEELYVFSNNMTTAVEWYLYNSDPPLKESIGTTPADDALCTTASDGVYTLPKAGYCTNLIEDLRTAIEDLVSWGVWKNPSTGNAYNWTDSDADNAYHCAMAACYADYGLTSAG
jgi:hypothetical protein